MKTCRVLLLARQCSGIQEPSGSPAGPASARGRRPSARQASASEGRFNPNPGRVSAAIRVANAESREQILAEQVGRVFRRPRHSDVRQGQKHDGYDSAGESVGFPLRDSL